MYDSNSKGISYTAGFFIIIGFAIVGLFVGTLISVPVWTSMTGKGILEMKDQLGNPAYSSAFKVVQVISTLFGFFIPAIAAAVLLNRRPYKLLGFTKKFHWIQILVVLAIMFLALFSSELLGYINQHIPVSASLQKSFQKLENDYNSQVEAIMQLKNFSDYLLGLFIMAFLPALCEETLFRGGLQNFLTRSIQKPWLAILIVSILFSAVHFSFYGFLPRMFLGILLGLIYYYTGSLWLSILAHFANNAFAVSQFYFSHNQSIKQAAEENTPLLFVYVGLVVLPFIIYLLMVLKRISPPPDHRGTSLSDIRNKVPWEINN
ncbi:MAG: type II CAAX prenyl endopeptidase Rce1 family protein [Chitinophagales bacterium]